MLNYIKKREYALQEAIEDKAKQYGLDGVWWEYTDRNIFIELLGCTDRQELDMIVVKIASEALIQIKKEAGK